LSPAGPARVKPIPLPTPAAASLLPPPTHSLPRRRRRLILIPRAPHGSKDGALFVKEHGVGVMTLGCLKAPISWRATRPTTHQLTMARTTEARLGRARQTNV
jgi:hypothetical protein